MYCSVKIPVSYGGEKVLVVVTELDYIPRMKQAKGNIPARVEARRGFVVARGKKKLEFNAVYAECWGEIEEVCLNWYTKDELVAA